MQFVFSNWQPIRNLFHACNYQSKSWYFFSVSELYQQASMYNMSKEYSALNLPKSSCSAVQPEISLEGAETEWREQT